MKKAVAFCAALVMLVTLAACNQSKGTVSSTPKVVSSEAPTLAESSDSGLQINESQLNDIGKPKSECNFTVDQIVDVIDKSLQENDLDALSSKATRVADYNDAQMGKVNENQYQLGNGILLSVYSDKENNKVTGFQFYIDMGNATKESINYYSKCADSTIKYMEPNNVQLIERTLKLSNISNNDSTTVNTEKYTYSYDVRDGTDVLCIGLKKS